jgi:uncharacterized phage protein gp47/JayE
MPNSIGPTGLAVATQAEIYANYVSSYETIYGANIDLSSTSPDGQMLNEFIQSVLDIEDLLVQINNMFDPDNAVGVILDQRVAINGIQRQAGTFTVTNITLVLTTNVNLYGLDQTDQPVYTVSDNAGNQWQLQTTELGVGPGTVVYSFQAALPGNVQSIPNTITVPVSIVLGVQSINNPTTYTDLGVNEESDAQLKVRRQQSVSLASQGYLAGLYAALKNTPGVSYAQIYENDLDGPDINGIPGHSIWIIIGGSATAAAIGNVIYIKRNGGCGMKGTQSYTLTQVNGLPFTAFWDDVIPETLFISFTANSVDGINPPNIAAISAQLPVLLSAALSVDSEVNITQLGTLVQEIDPNTFLTFTSSGMPAAGGFSTAVGGAYTPTLIPTAKNNQFVASSPNIVILPMILSQFNPISMTPIQVTHATTQTFTGLGGYGALTYSFVTNNSGGSINAGSGLYTAGSAGFTDTIEVTDSLGNTAQAVISVI